MSPVFSHGRLRLYLLKLLAEGPKHGYELIRLLENQFLGLYAPSAGTIYPRLQRMEADGLVRHTQAGGRKVYEITADGRGELAARAGELASLESEIDASVADLSTLANEVEQGVRGSVRDIKKELREAAKQVRGGPQHRGNDWPFGADMSGGWAGPWPDKDQGRPWSSDQTNDIAADLERKAGALLAEVRRLAGTGKPSAEAVRATSVILDAALDQVRKLLR
jgi:DNA-binding PadR family transcriptional regulator